MNTAEFWEEFKKFKGDDSLKYYESFHFELTKELANKLLSLVLQGKKKATSSSLYAYQAEKCPLPKIGSYSIVTDFDNNPKCVIETTHVTIIPFNEMTFEICKREGENDTLESWKQGHRRFFTNEGKECGYTFSQDMPLVFEDFKVVFSK